MSYRNSMKIFGFVFMLVGIIAAVFVAYGVIKQINFHNGYEQIDARISQVYNNGCEVTYQYRGEEYCEAQYNFTSSSMHVGKIVKIYIKPYAPYVFVLKSAELFGLILPGIFFVVFFTIGLIVFKLGTKGRIKVKPDWKYVNAEVVDVVVNSLTYVNGRNPFKVVCKYVDPYTGKDVLFYSGNCMADPGDVYEPNEPIKVYVKDDTLKKYKVDLTKYYNMGMR